jgi:cellulose biosynthesis protein BcsQ
MPLLNSYAIWNNKGGVGKSTVCFHLAARYAERNPNHRVLVIDLCPQANSSMMLLGGGPESETRVLNLGQQQVPHTVVGYLATVLSQAQTAPLPDPAQFVTQVSTLNHHLPQNIFLVCGDGNLEPMAPLISERAGQALLLPGQSPSWLWVHQVFRRLIEQVTTNPNERWLVLVDTNPSFSIYTEIAISAVNRLIVPVNADDASRVATNAMFTLIYGANPPHPVYGTYTYASRADNFNLTRPLVHLIVGNRLTQYDGPAAAFGAISDATANVLYTAYQNFPNRFSAPAAPVTTMRRFRDAYSVPLRDFNTSGVVAAHLGRPLSSLRAGHYPVHAAQVQVNAARTRECLEAIDLVVNRL